MEGRSFFVQGSALQRYKVGIVAGNSSLPLTIIKTTQLENKNNINN